MENWLSRVNCTMMSTLFAVHGFHHGSAFVLSLNSSCFYAELLFWFTVKILFLWWCFAVLNYNQYYRQKQNLKVLKRNLCFWYWGNTWVAYVKSVGGLALIPHGYIKTNQTKKALRYKQHACWYIQHGTRTELWRNEILCDL